MTQNSLDIEKTIREYIPTIIHMSLATCADNKPWVCEVHFAFDDDLNIYFKSNPKTRHCKEIEINPNVSGNIVEQHNKNMKPRGVYFEGKAELVEVKDKNNPAFIAYDSRFGLDESDLEDFKDEDGHRLYKITVEKFYIFDARESKPSQKYELDWKQKL